MSAPTAPPVRAGSRWLLRAVVVSLVLAGAGTSTVMLYASGWGETFAGSGVDVGTSVLFVVWALAPVAGAGVAAVLSHRHLRRGWLAVAVGAVAVVALAVVAMLDFLTSDSSTAALIFLFLPLVQWLVVLATTAVGAGVHAVRGRR